MTTEQQRLDEAAHQNIPWKKWGPYLSEANCGRLCGNLDFELVAISAETRARKIKGRARYYLSQPHDMRLQTIPASRSGPSRIWKTRSKFARARTIPRNAARVAIPLNDAEH
jgi:hypothetical protein